MTENLFEITAYPRKDKMDAETAKEMMRNILRVFNKQIRDAADDGDAVRHDVRSGWDDVIEEIKNEISYVSGVNLIIKTEDYGMYDSVYVLE